SDSRCAPARHHPPPEWSWELRSLSRDPGSLVDDGVGKAPHLEQRRDATHGFGVAQADEAAGEQVLVEVFRRDPSRRIVEVNEDIAAKDDVELAVRSGLIG